MKRGGPLRRVAGGRRADRVLAWSMLRADVHQRDNGRCLLCDEFTSLVDFECHHRKLKSRGGRDEHANLITLCSRCHHDRVHAFPQWANAVGLMVPSWAEPTAWPVLCRFAGLDAPWALWAVPDDDGTWIVTAPHPDQHDEPAPWEALP